MHTRPFHIFVKNISALDPLQSHFLTYRAMKATCCVLIPLFCSAKRQVHIHSTELYEWSFARFSHISHGQQYIEKSPRTPLKISEAVGSGSSDV